MTRKPKRGRPPADIPSRNLTLWLPIDLHAALVKAAKTKRVSLNAEVRARLYRTFKPGAFK
jgi:predicted HicB family RNase H-like nuclease